jgi:hypothetical protein
MQLDEDLNANFYLTMLKTQSTGISLLDFQFFRGAAAALAAA